MLIKIINLKKTIEKFGDISNIDLTPEIVEATRKVQRKARDLAPVDTGALKASIKTKIRNRGKSNVTGIVYTTLEYAPYQEFGTLTKGGNIRMLGQPFMTPAILQERLGIQQSLKKYIKEQLRNEANKN